jgi:DNA helicase TIP49 (TBP-interacting protein)
VLGEARVQVDVHVDELGLEQRGEVDELVDHLVGEVLAG